MRKRVTAGEIASKALRDNTKYDMREIAHASTEDLSDHIYESARLYRDKIEEDIYCVVMVIASDPLIHNLKRRKFYCWPWLPSPRPNQCVFLYNKRLDKVFKRLWVLPCAQTMAELATSSLIVHKQYQTMQAWSVAFFKGTFWEYIRHEHDIKMLSQEEHFELARKELLKSGIQISELNRPQPFDFSKIVGGNFSDPGEPTPT